MRLSTLPRRGFLQFLGAAGFAAGCSATHDQATSDVTEQSGRPLADDEFEYIVVGSGAGGGPLASNLARAGHKVLLLEAGGDHGDKLDYQVPAFHPQSTEDPAMRWDYFVKHYADATRQAEDSKSDERGVLYPRAGTLGGCTAHNAMITVYPHESDFEYLADLTGDDSFRAANMRRYFQLLEDCQYLGANDDKTGHGESGWLTTSKADPKLALGDFKILTIVKSAAEAWSDYSGEGFFGSLGELTSLMRRDLNSAAPDRDQREGLYTVPMATRKGKRIGPRELILKTIADGFPLTLRLGSLVSRVVFAEERDEVGRVRATGVEVLTGERLYRADPNADASVALGDTTIFKATREVVLSAGAFNTPQLLKLSGVGPRDELTGLGIDVRVELPGVGTNLQDRYEVGVVSELDGDFSLLKGCTFGATAKDPCLASWRKNQGVYTSNGSTVAIVMKSSDAAPEPDLFVFGLPGVFKGYEPGYSTKIFADKHHFTWAVLKAHTKNTAGTVTLRSSDPRDVPEIVFRYFDEGSTDQGQDTSDLEAVATGIELVRNIVSRTSDNMPFGKFEEVFPGPEVASRDDLKALVKREAWGHHASCTCPIGEDGDPMAVLDGRFKVRGTANVRVVDASIFPKIPGFFIVTSIYMMSEKATDVLLEELGETRA